MTAYIQYLLRESNNNKDRLAGLLYMEIYENQSSEVFEMIAELQGDKEVTKETFFNLADKIITDSKI